MSCDEFDFTPTRREEPQRLVRVDRPWPVHFLRQALDERDRDWDELWESEPFRYWLDEEDEAADGTGDGEAPLSGAGPSTLDDGDGPPPPLAQERIGCLSVRPSRRTSRAAFFDEGEIDPADPLLGFAPFLHPAPRRNSITPDRQRAFIAALAACGIVTQAARVIGASLEALYKLRHRRGAEGFSAAWDMAIDRGMARLEDCALERAIQGEVRPVVSQGRVVATYLRHDTQLMLFLLRSRRAARFSPDPRDPQPGSALYQRVLEDHRSRQPSRDDVLESINAKIENIRQRRLAEQARNDADRDVRGEEELESYGGA